MEELFQLAERVAQVLAQQKLRLVTAESCTGGELAYLLTSIPGASAWFERGFVTYSNEAKQELLGVPADIIERHGAVSRKTAEAMAEGALRNSHAQISVSVTGIAGPQGGSLEKPVGTVWIAWRTRDKNCRAEVFCFQGDRMQIRHQSARTALTELLRFI